MQHPETVVVRFGLMLPADLSRSVRTYWLEYQVYALSVWSIPGLPAAGIARRVGLRHAVIRSTTVSVIRAAGYDVTDSDARGHCQILLPDPPTEDDWRRLSGCFGAAVPNPVLGD